MAEDKKLFDTKKPSAGEAKYNILKPIITKYGTRTMGTIVLSDEKAAELVKQGRLKKIS